MSRLSDLLASAQSAGHLLPAARVNIESMLEESADPVAACAIAELTDTGAWDELNERFCQTLNIGPDGLSGRTIGRIVTTAEQGAGGPDGRPEWPCVGTATINYSNVSRAVRGLIAHVQRHVGGVRKARLVFAYDTRHFSREFAGVCATTCAELGCDAFLFDGPRSAAQLSFTVREMRADAGAVLAAGGNPPHDNGFKAYFDDGAQLVEPHASAIISEVNAIARESIEPLPEAARGSITLLGAEMDQRYVKMLRTLLLEPSLLAGAGMKIVYTNLHGTGGHIIVPLLRELGCEVQTVAAQDVLDGRFPTVESPNPANAQALEMAIGLAEACGAELVIGTDSDAGRMGVAARDAAGRMVVLTGNQVGSLLAWYRLKTCFELGLLTDSNRSRAVLVKTWVSGEMQRAIADGFGVGMVETPSGFKHIARKLRKYEDAIPADKKGDYRSLSQEATRALRLEYSRFMVFGADQSYGYLGSDALRDKDANGAALMLAEVAAYAKSVGKTLPELMDDIYREYGYHLEIVRSLVMEGADGAPRFQALADSYAHNPPASVDGAEVVRLRDFARQDLFDQEGDLLPKAKMLLVDLADGRAFAVWPSDNQREITYDLFGKAAPGGELETAKAQVRSGVDSLWKWIKDDARSRGKT